MLILASVLFSSKPLVKASVSFGAVDEDSAQYYFDFFVEFCFLVDLIMNIFLSYTDPDTFLPVQNLAKIAKRYLW